MKVKCLLPIDVELDLGYKRHDGESNNAALVRIVQECPHKELRPCAKWQGWVIKEEMCQTCKYCVDVLK